MPPRLARLLAVIAAIALVAGAFALRGALSDDDDGEGRSGVPDAPGAGDGERYRVICDTDLGESACTAVADATGAEVETMRAGDVLALAPEDLATYDAWLTLDPMPGVLDTARDEVGLGPVAGEAAAVASEPLALLTFEDSRLDCGAEPDWTCLTEQVVRPAVAVPDVGTSIGTLAIAAGAAGLADDEGFGIEDYRGTEESDALSGLLDDSPGGDTARQTLDALQPGASSAAVTIAGLGDIRAETVRGQERRFTVQTLAPGVTLGVVLAGLGERGADAVAALSEGVTEQTVGDALAEGGWDGEPTGSTGLPDADLIYALRDELS